MNERCQELMLEAFVGAVNGIDHDMRQLTTNLNRPHVYMRPTLDKNQDGTWTCWYDSVMGRGKTPQEACDRFDAMWLNGTNEAKGTK